LAIGLGVALKRAFHHSLGIARLFSILVLSVADVLAVSVQFKPVEMVESRADTRSISLQAESGGFRVFIRVYSCPSVAKKKLF